MNILDELKAKADTNGDGKVDRSDIEALKSKYPDYADTLDELKAKADANNDGRVNFSDVSDLFGDLKDGMSEFGKKIFGQ